MVCFYYIMNLNGFTHINNTGQHCPFNYVTSVILNGKIIKALSYR